MKARLSIIILSYNTLEQTKQCLNSLEKNRGEVDFKVIVVDNASKDESPTFLSNWKNDKDKIFISSNENLGFAKGNNLAKKYCNTEYVLFLNSDTIVKKDALSYPLKYLDENKDTAAVSVKTVLPNGEMDKDTRRSFPTPWVSFTHMSRLDRIFPNSKVFSKYWYGYMSENSTHEVDVIQGAFFMARKNVLDSVGWFSEDYFLDAEDIDLCWKIKSKNHKIVYYPEAEIVHIKGASKGKSKTLKKTKAERLKSTKSGVDSMEIFYRKRLMENYLFIVNWIMLISIKILKSIRAAKIIFYK